MKIKSLEILFFCYCMFSKDIKDIIETRFKKGEFIVRGYPDYSIKITLQFENDKLHYYWSELNNLEQSKKQNNVSFSFSCFAEFQNICDSIQETIFDN